MDLSNIFGTFNPVRFIEEHYQRLPFALAGAAVPVCALGSQDVFEELLLRPEADMLVVRRGVRCGRPDPKSREEARELVHEGHTILLRHAEQLHPEIKALAEVFERTFECPVNVHVYATPADSFGFSWHYDAEEVFIVQTTGEKEYALRKNTIHPWPLEETLPADMLYERELMPLMRTKLRAGDLLYIPCGYWHKASTTANSGLAISLAIGVMSRSAVTILDSLRPRLVEDLLWRQRLPVTCHLSREEAAERYRQVITMLAADLDCRLNDPALLEHLIGGHTTAESLPS